MTEKYLIVFGENADQQIKKNLGQIKSHKEAQWLYEGILYLQDESNEELVAVVFKDPKFIPSAIIDNGKWLAPALFGHNQKIWRDVLSQCLAMTDRGHIHCYTFVD